LADRKNVRVTGELKIPGFSLYLHPVGPNRLLGVGFDADDQGDFAWYQGLQVRLFDTQDPANPRNLHDAVFGERGSYSDVNSDHHAFHLNEQLGLVSIPMVLFKIDSDMDPTKAPWEMAQKFIRSGLTLLNSQDLNERGTISHVDLIPAKCRANLALPRWWDGDSSSLDANRTFSYQGQLVSVSPFAVRVHPSLALRESDFTLPLPDSEAYCE
jgi:hypothetical protein